jgi:hypothetical protein
MPQKHKKACRIKSRNGQFVEITLILTTLKRFKLTTLKRSMLTTPKRSMLTT